MKRFYCTTCKRVVRVRNLPRVSNPHADKPVDRIGECDRHNNLASARNERMGKK